MSRERPGAIGGYLRQHWRRVSLISTGGVAGLLILVQLIFPWGHVPLYETIDGVSVGGKSVSEATKQLDDMYKKLKVGVYFGKNPQPYREPRSEQFGVTIQSRPQVESAQYSWWLRLVPTSLWWAHAVTNPASPSYSVDTSATKSYVTKELGESCDVTPVNASLVYKDKKLTVVPAIDGGTCNLDDVEGALGSIKPRLTSHTVRIPINERPAKIHDDEAKDVADKIADQTKNGVAISAGDQDVTVSQQELLSWLDFEAPDSGIFAKVNSTRSKDFFDKQLLPKVSRQAGVSKVTTLDFTEIARADGSNGQTLDVEATVTDLNDWLQNKNKRVEAKTKVVPPTVSYTRTYTPTDTGFSALLEQYARSHPGTYGVSFAELDGKRRHAVYQGDRVYRTASTYKLFVAYGALKRIESGAWKWSDQIQGGRDLTKCLDDMIVKSDNACGEVMLSKIGFRTLTNELQAIGLKKSSFLHDFPETTAGDLTTFVGALQAGQLLNQSSTNTLLGAMKRNVYRQGIPAGANGQTADKVGFLDAFLHDAAIVYSPSGVYALTVMTEGSSWAAIADLTKQIEKLRTQ